MSALLDEWRHAPVRIVDTSTERDHGATVIEIRLYGLENGQIGQVVGLWYPTTVISSRHFLKAFRHEDTWITLEQLEQLLSMEGLVSYGAEIRHTFEGQLAFTEAKPAARHRARAKNFLWACAVAVGLAALTIAPIAYGLFNH